ncbi:ABC transporter permease [Thermasporomyces composti]|uniref:Transport permease protein n=1 Tax=Thermasporomyces composti TaxID=696763 RepID=A0A3D9V6T7_THECX|nr:ABC transporter permease [Thermasporomyces composti]REF37502.1 teichoic acid transport system permease protein [Thermasporomyces composti]
MSAETAHRSEPLSAAELAARYGLRPSSARPPLATYVRQLWQRRHFIVAFATSRTVSQYSGARLGQLWQVLTPLLNAAVYYLLFGVLLGTRRNIDNFTAFLVTGVFLFTFSQRSVTAGARAISGNLRLIRALHFPRAALPISSTLVELQQMLISVCVLGLIVLLTGEPLTWRWLLVIPVLTLQTLFNLGISLAIARVGAKIPDITQLLPFVTRTWLYMSGVFFSIYDRVPAGPIREAMLANPAAVYIELTRGLLLEGHYVPSHTWVLGVAWALVTLVGGFLFFWAAEERYGRG